MNIDLGELDKLEDELNDLSNSSKSADTKSIGGLGNGLGSFFGFGKENVNIKANSNTNESSSSNIGQATAESMGNTKTWDGFSKLNDIQQGETYSSSSKLSEREKRRKKRYDDKKNK